jgi:hypothetical protein
MDQSAISLRLKTARQAMGYVSARSFALKFGFKYTSYLHHELNEKRPSVETLARYANCLQINLGWLITGEGTPTRMDANQKAMEQFIPDSNATLHMEQSDIRIDFAKFTLIFFELVRYEFSADKCFRQAIELYNDWLEKPKLTIDQLLQRVLPPNNPSTY